MEITIIGIVVMILSVYAFFKDEKVLLYLLVFFSTFTAASIVNIPKTVTGISPIYLVGGLWMLKVLIKYMKEGSLKEKIIKIMPNNKLIKALIIFFIVIVLSEINLLIFSGKISYTELNLKSLKVIEFSGSNITQPIYVSFMILLSIFIILEVRSKSDIAKLIKVFTFSCIFAMVWGIGQFCIFYLNIPYPDYLFNNHIALGQLFNQMIYGVKRVNSIALEPSTFALNILQFLPVMLILWLSNYRIHKNEKKSNYILISLIILALICGILTTSTTAYLGLALLMLFSTIYIVFFSIKGGDLSNNKKRIAYLYLIAFISLLLIILLTLKVFNMNPQTLIDTLKDVTVNKAKLATGHERFNAIKMSFEIFKQSPILGSGWGSFRSLDLLTNLISNLGIVGLVVYIYILVVVIKKCIINRKANESLALAGAMSVIIPTIALMVSIPDLVFGYYWIGIALVYNYLDDRDKEGIR